MFKVISMKIRSLLRVITNRTIAAKLFVILLIGFVVFFYIIDLSSLQQLRFKLPLINDEENRKWDWKFMEDMDREDRILYQSYFIDTEGCRMPSFKVFDKNVEKFLSNSQPIDCGKPLVRSNNKYMWIDLNESEMKNLYKINNVDDILCEYKPFRRRTDFENEFPKMKLKRFFRYGEIVPINDEFVQVVCRSLELKMKVYKDYHFFVQNKQKTSELNERNLLFEINNKDRDDENTNNEFNKPMSVMVFGIDSVSRLNFHRQMKKSSDVLLNDLRAIEMFGFNKIADNTYPNLIPALTGLDEDELNASCIPEENDVFDRCHFIWNTFKEKNFTTAYSEDSASLGLFQYLKNGFRFQPTDYSMRPILIELERQMSEPDGYNTFLCLGKRRTFDILLEYVKKFITTITKRLHFSFFWSTSYTHDYFDHPTLIDESLANFLRELQTSDTLDNLFLIIMSDHGIRYGSFRGTYQGMMEERQPFVFFIPPKQFLERYPEAMRNLVRNRRRLTTPFDLYETMRDLANLKSLESKTIKKRSKDFENIDPMPRGISLFLPVPGKRSCNNAAIAAHWCTCHERNDKLDLSDFRVGKLARLIVARINDMIILYPQCHRLQLNSILSANLGTTNTNFQNMSDHFVDITVQLQTRPGLGEFEATARIHKNNNFELTGTISRTNLYGSQSYCVNDYKMKLYCYCDRYA